MQQVGDGLARAGGDNESSCSTGLTSALAATCTAVNSYATAAQCKQDLIRTWVTDLHAVRVTAMTAAALDWVTPAVTVTVMV
jgi:hypothetical protein